MTSSESSPSRRKFKLFSFPKSVKKTKMMPPQSTPKDLSPPTEMITVPQEDKLSDKKASPRQLFPQQFAHNQSLKSKSNQKSFLTKSKQFQKLVDWSFQSIDVDQSGQVDKKELYSGLILIHLKLAAYIGPAACRPASREYVEEIFEALDEDESGELNREEFGKVMTMLISQLGTRVIVQLTLTLVVVPMMAGYILNLLSLIFISLSNVLNGLHSVQEMKVHWLSFVQVYLTSRLPDLFFDAWKFVQIKIDGIVTKEMKEKIPVTVLSVILGMLLVPWAFMKCDDFFEKVNRIKRRKK